MRIVQDVKFLHKVAILSIMFTAVTRIVFRTNLFADGSYHLYYILENNKPIFTDGREFIQFLDQFLTYLLINFMEVTNTSILSYSMGIGYTLLPAILITIAILKLQTVGLLGDCFVAAGVLVFVFSGSIGEALPAFAVIFLALALILNLTDLKFWERIALTVLLMISIRSYETNALYLLILFLIYWLKLRIVRKRKLHFLDSILMLLGIASSAKWILFPYGGTGNRNSIFAPGVLTANPGFDGLVFAILGCSILAVIFGLLSKYFQIAKTLYVSIILIFGLIVCFVSPLTLSVFYHDRIHIQIPFVLLCLVSILLLFQNKSIEKSSPFISHFLIAICIVGSLLNFQLAKDWWGFTNRFQQAQIDFSTSREISIDKLNIVNEDRHFIWAWTNESMSIVLRRSTDAAIIVHSESYQGPTYVDLKDLDSFKQYYWK